MICNIRMHSSHVRVGTIHLVTTWLSPRGGTQVGLDQPLSNPRKQNLNPKIPNQNLW